MKDDMVFFLPTRKGSQRIKNKNTKSFSHFQGGILELKLTQLLESKKIDTVILSTNDEESVNVARKVDRNGVKIMVIERPNHLCLDTTNLTDLINYVPTITDATHILWGHVTTPFVEGNDYDIAIDAYFEKLNQGYDSLLSVLPLKNFLFKQDGQIINNSSSLKWPRTQDLIPLYEVNHSIFIASRQVYIEKKNRIGDKPFLYEMGKLKSVDIDWEEDFEIAEALYEKFGKL